MVTFLIASSLLIKVVWKISFQLSLSSSWEYHELTAELFCFMFSWQQAIALQIKKQAEGPIVTPLGLTTLEQDRTFSHLYEIHHSHCFKCDTFMSAPSSLSPQGLILTWSVQSYVKHTPTRLPTKDISQKGNWVRSCPQYFFLYNVFINGVLDCTTGDKIGVGSKYMHF